MVRGLETKTILPPHYESNKILYNVDRPLYWKPVVMRAKYEIYLNVLHMAERFASEVALFQVALCHVVVIFLTTIQDVIYIDCFYVIRLKINCFYLIIAEQKSGIK